MRRLRASGSAAGARARTEAAERERDQVTGREGELLAALEAARSELVALHARLSESETLIEGGRAEAAAALRAAEDLRAAMAALTAERDAARAEADRARRRVDALTALNGPMAADGRPVNGIRPIVDEEPPTGLHALPRDTRHDLRTTGGPTANGRAAGGPSP